MDTKYGAEKDTFTNVSASNLAWLQECLVELRELDVKVNEHPD